MVLESSEPKENDNILKKKNFSSFWGVSGPPKTPEKPKKGGFRGPKTPKNEDFFFKFYHFLWALSFPEQFSYLIFNFMNYF